MRVPLPGEHPACRGGLLNCWILRIDERIMILRFYLNTPASLKERKEGALRLRSEGFLGDRFRREELTAGDDSEERR